MKTHQTRDTSRNGSRFFNAARIWKPLALAAILPLFAACTDTVTGVQEFDGDNPPAEQAPEPTDDGAPVAL